MTSYPKEKLKVLLLENVNQQAVEAFIHNGYTNTTLLKKAYSEEELLKEIADVHILGIRSKTHISEAVLKEAHKLLAIGCFCIGTNQVALDAAAQHGVAVFNAPYSNTRSVAELVIGATIMLIRRIPDKNKMAHEGVWMKDSSNSHEVRGKTLGIIGYGNIGSQVSVLAEGLGMKVRYYDTVKKLPLGNAQSVHTLEELVSISDVISIHTPSVKQTQNMINQEVLSHAKKGSVFINYARGEVVDINALKWAIEEGILSGAAVDVYPVEPEKNGAAFTSVLQGLPNVLLTPHIGGSTEEAQVDIGVDVSAKLIDFIETGSSNGSHTIPALNLPIQEGTHRILHIHRNVPGVLSAINMELSKNGINILGQYLKTTDAVGYVVLDVNSKLSGNAFAILKEIKDTIKVRMVF